MHLNVFNRSQNTSPEPLPLFDETFLRRLERLSYRTAASLRGSMLGERRSRKLRPALDFSDHRPYSSGDDLRHVDWNAFARHQELFVKLGETTQSVNIHILLDRSRSMAWESRQKVTDNVASSTKWDGARRLVGAMGYLALASGERLQIGPFAQKLDRLYGPTRGKRQVITLLQFLTAIQPAPALSSTENRGLGLAQSLASYARANADGGLLVLISDLLDTGDETDDASDESRWGEDLAEGLRHLSPPRWQVVVMHLLTEQELNPKFKGDFDLQDVETGEDLPFHLVEETLDRYRDRVRRWCAAMESACARRGAVYSRIVAEWPMEKSVIPYLRQRGVVQ